jgi:hypothetical protein
VKPIALLLLLLMPLMGLTLRGVAAQTPQPPCAPPAIRVWRRDDMGEAWVPPACTGWTTNDFTLLVALASQFRFRGDADAMLARFGAISSFVTIRYWAINDQRWRDLFGDAAALDGPGRNIRRPDFSPAEMRSGRDLYFQQVDNRTTGKVVYRMRVISASDDRIMLLVENATPVRWLFFSLFGPGDLQSLYFLQRRSPELWDYYTMLHVGSGASMLASGHDGSYVNRVTALYRYIAGIPTDLEPPAAPH